MRKVVFFYSDKHDQLLQTFSNGVFLIKKTNRKCHLEYPVVCADLYVVDQTDAWHNTTSCWETILRRTCILPSRHLCWPSYRTYFLPGICAGIHTGHTSFHASVLAFIQDILPSRHLCWPSYRTRYLPGICAVFHTGHTTFQASVLAFIQDTLPSRHLCWHSYRTYFLPYICAGLHTGHATFHASVLSFIQDILPSRHLCYIHARHTTFHAVPASMLEILYSRHLCWPSCRTYYIPGSCTVLHAGHTSFWASVLAFMQTSSLTGMARIWFPVLAKKKK